MTHTARRLATWTATLAAALALSGCGYNQFQTLDEQVKAGWSEVLNQYQRRADLIPNIAAGSLISSGVAWIEVALDRASITLVSVSCSKLASPLTVATILGIRSARRWYWFNTSLQPALTCSSNVWNWL